MVDCRLAPIWRSMLETLGMAFQVPLSGARHTNTVRRRETSTDYDCKVSSWDSRKLNRYSSSGYIQWIFTQLNSVFGIEL
ncbi:hypothetical protein PV327_002892 [Microctonus hyperodae]|uniref:Uncharacterized protein n=1 Tax=Microctonus hyperodae TaxID=165561 RepID=A0AA39FGR0_MICHY|nr:hypothetical protein PV327_002892 [Microctonus hyperodae]